jgi:hypothetical protein
MQFNMLATPLAIPFPSDRDSVDVRVVVWRAATQVGKLAPRPWVIVTSCERGLGDTPLRAITGSFSLAPHGCAVGQGEHTMREDQSDRREWGLQGEPKMILPWSTARRGST